MKTAEFLGFGVGFGRLQWEVYDPAEPAWFDTWNPTGVRRDDAAKWCGWRDGGMFRGPTSPAWIWMIVCSP